MARGKKSAFKRKAKSFQDGANKSSSIGKKKRAVPKSTSKAPPSRLKGDINVDQQGNRANVRQNTTRQGNRRSA